MKDASFVEVKVASTSVIDFKYVIFLQKEGDDRWLPIIVGLIEAQAVMVGLSPKQFTRPFTHDLFKAILEKITASVTRVYISFLDKGMFIARVYIRTEEGVLEFGARPSDAIALALRFCAPVYVGQDLFEKCAVNLNEARKEVEKQQPPAQKLKEALDKAVADERYEDAAKIRDEIQQIASKN